MSAVIFCHPLERHECLDAGVPGDVRFLPIRISVLQSEAGGRSQIVNNKRKTGEQQVDEREHAKDLEGRAAVRRSQLCPPFSRRGMRYDVNLGDDQVHGGEC